MKKYVLNTSINFLYITNDEIVEENETIKSANSENINKSIPTIFGYKGQIEIIDGNNNLKDFITTYELQNNEKIVVINLIEKDGRYDLFTKSF